LSPISLPLSLSLPPPWRSTRARAATLLICLFVAAFGSSGLATWAALSQPVDQGIETRLRREMTAVQRLYLAHDPETAARLIQQRERRPSGFEFRIADGRGRRIAGDLPEGSPYDLGLTTIQTEPRSIPNSYVDDSDEADEDVGQRLRVLTVAAPGGALLSLGEDLGRTRALKSLFLRTFILTSGAALMIALAVGLGYISRILSRIEQIALTADAVSGEDMGHRAPVGDPARSDDIDRLALSVNRMLDRIAGLLRSVRQVSDDVAHDLRTPLAHLKQRIETALSGPPSVASYREALEGASDKIDEVLATFEALLSIAQMEAGSKTTAFHPVDLSDVAAAVAEAYRPSAEDSGHRLLLHGVSAATVQGERSLITQMLANLVANALIHTPSGATVHIRTDRIGERVRLSVCDDGPGVRDEARDLIFRRFFRVERSRTTPGSGLGLSLAAAVASVHGATIRAEDASPGLRIVVDFPSPAEHLT
jgi:signal transduction histidine kinase